LKYGLYTAEAVETRRMVAALTKQARELVETVSATAVGLGNEKGGPDAASCVHDRCKARYGADCRATKPRTLRE
jgi:hypothetical protein